MKPAIVCSDLHLLKKPGMWSGRADIQGDDKFALHQIIDLCIEYKADLYILGDVLDTATTLPRPLVILQQEFARLKEAAPDTVIRYIQGQHEMSVQSYAEHRPWLDVVGMAEHISRKSFDFLGLKAYALDYFPPGFSVEAFSTIPEDAEVLFLHGTADQAMPFNPHFHVEEIPQNVRLVFAGDYHDPIELAYPRGDQEKGKLMYCGSTWMTETSEAGPRYVFLAEHDGEDIVWQRLQLKTRPIFWYSKLEDGLLEQSFDDLPEEVRKPLVLIDLPVDADELGLISTKAFTYITRSGKPGESFADRTLTCEEEEELSDSIVLGRFVDEHTQKSEFEFTLDVLNSPVEDAVGRLKQRLGVQ